MANVVEQRGFFWWINEPNGQTNSKETSVPGLLTISEEGHIELNLDGALWYAEPPEPVRWGVPRLLPHNKWITGRLGAYGDHVLLCGLERNDYPVLDEIPNPQSYESEICITRDSPFSVDFDLERFHHLRVELVGLEEWLRLDSIQVEIQDFQEQHVELSVKYKRNRLSYAIAEGNISIESMTLGVPFCTTLGFPPTRSQLQANELPYLYPGCRIQR